MKTMNDYYNERHRRKRSGRTLLWIICFEIIVLLGGLAAILIYREHRQDELIEEGAAKIDYIVNTEPETDTAVPAPQIDDQILSVNEYSRPGEKIKSLDYIVIHYLANPETTAQENHDYFESLKYRKDAYMSANYVIGIDGEIIHCVPDDEVAYASNQANSYSISIENCHVDDSGKFTDATYTSLVHLTAYLSDKYGMDREHIIRHYDVTGKDCPKYFVENPEKWEQFLDEVMAYREECLAEALERIRQKNEVTGVDELNAFLEDNNVDDILANGE